MDLQKREEQIKQFEKFLMVIFFSSARSVYFNQFFCPFYIWTFSDFGLCQITYWKITLCSCWTSRACTQTSCETRVCVVIVFLICCAYACQVWPPRSELTNNTFQIKKGLHFFTLNFECDNRYDKPLLCNSENSDIAWWNKNN